MLATTLSVYSRLEATVVSVADSGYADRSFRCSLLPKHDRRSTPPLVNDRFINANKAEGQRHGLTVLLVVLVSWEAGAQDEVVQAV